MPEMIQVVQRRVTLHTKACQHCGTPFLGPGNKRFCSDQCRNIVNQRLYWRRHQGTNRTDYKARKARKIARAAAKATAGQEE